MRYLNKLSIRTIILAGLTLRLLIMPVSGHWDLAAINMIAARFFTRGLAGFYDLRIATYPPLNYLFFAVYQKTISVFLGSDFSTWFGSAGLTLYKYPFVFRHFFLLKIPLMVFDLGLYAAMFTVVHQQRRKLLTWLWMFNPVSLYLIYAWGSPDIIPAFFTVLAVVWARKQKLALAFFSLGLGIAFKLFPLLFLPVILIVVTGSLKKRLAYLFLSLLPITVSTFPLWRDRGFLHQVFLSPQSQTVFHGELHVGSGHFLYLFLVAYILWLAYLYYRYQGNVAFACQACLVVFLLLYSLSAFTPPWFIWTMPFLIWWWVTATPPIRSLIGIFVATFFVMALYSETPVNVGLLGPLDPNLYEIPTPVILLDRYQADLSVKGFGLVRSLIAGIGFFLIIGLLLDQGKEDRLGVA